uniref:E3 ubiquitin-protein ligase TRIM33 n=1 Tax=Sphaeramia orbicularis TaxID=375764 RepID=A0A672Y4A5_9TELE
MDPSVSSDSVPSATDTEPSDDKSETAETVVEAKKEEENETESSDNNNKAPTPTSDGGDVSGGTAGAGGEEEADGSGSPTDTTGTNAEPAAATEAVPAGAGGDAPPVGGLSTEMSPPPTAPAAAATPVPAPINLLDTCAVCKQSLQSRDCEPKLLPCLHSFCLKCIPQPERQISLQVPGPHGQTDTHIVNVMRCPVCLQDYKQSDIIDNYFVKDTTEATSTSDEKSAQVCTSCEDNAGTIGFCVECGEWLCKTCVEAHQRVKITKDHKIRTKEDASASVGTAGQKPVFCPIHKQEPLKLFCETCDTLTCRDCQLLEHKEHRYQFLEEAFQNQKGMIESSIGKLQEKKNYVHYSVSQVQSRLKELNETHRKVEHEIKIAVFTLINEINKKGKSLLQQLESVTKERSMRLVAQHKDTTQLAQQIHHVLNFCHWAISTGSSTALLYSKRLILYQLRQLFKARLEPPPQANGVVRFFCDPTFWAKNVVNLGNLVIEKPPPPVQPPGVMAGGPPISPGQGHPGKHPGQINLAQLRLQHMQQAAYAQQKQQHQHHQQQQQHQQQIQQQMRIASQMSQQHARQAGPGMVQQQVQDPPTPHGTGQHSPHSNPGHAGPFPVASLHNANPTSPTSASMAGAHAHRGPASPVIGPIELIPSVTNPENLPCLPEIPPIQLEDAGSSSLGHLLSRYITASTQHQLGPVDMNASPGLSTHSPGSSGTHSPAERLCQFRRCSSSGRAAASGSSAAVDPVRVKQEPGTDDSYNCPSSSVKTERGKDGRSALINNGGTPLTNGNADKRAETKEGGVPANVANPTQKDDDPNEDWCAVCINGGDLLCCDRCPKVFHMKCHVPTIKIFPKGDFLCTFCRSVSSPEIEYCDDSRRIKGERSLSPEDQRRCERILLFIFCHELSVGFREPVPSSVPNYYKIIKQPMDLKKVKKKLQLRSSQYYQSTQEFVSDMRLVFKNCAQYNEMSRIIQVYDEEKQINTQVSSEMAISGKAVSLYFEEKLQQMFPGQSFPEVSDADFPEPTDKNEDEDTDDSGDDFIQPRRKRLKTDDKVVHIK